MRSFLSSQKFVPEVMHNTSHRQSTPKDKTPSNKQITPKSVPKLDERQEAEQEDNVVIIDVPSPIGSEKSMKEAEIPTVETDQQELIVCLFRDMTQKKQQEELLKQSIERAEQANTAKSEFLAFMCHELRNPLHNIVGSAALLSDIDLIGESKELVDSIVSSSNLMSCIVNDVLDLSKVKSGAMKLESVPFDLHDLLKDLEKLHQRVKPINVTWSCIIGETVPKLVEHDPTRLRQVMLNLIGNAFKVNHIRAIHEVDVKLRVFDIVVLLLILTFCLLLSVYF